MGHPAASFADWKGHSGDNGSPQSSTQSPARSSASSSGHNSNRGSDHGSNRSAGHDFGRRHDHAYAAMDLNLSVWSQGAGYYYDGPYYPPEDAYIDPSIIYQPAVPSVTVVEPPPTESIVQPAVTTPVTVDIQDSYTVNIPNDKGGYTAVILNRSREGFIGPQGEFYPEFPKVWQLKLMYGKS